MAPGESEAVQWTSRGRPAQTGQPVACGKMRGRRRPPCARTPARHADALAARSVRRSGALAHRGHRRGAGLTAVADEFGHLPRGPSRILKATIWSMQGLRAAWLHESSFRLEVYLLVVIAPLGIWLGNTGVERALLVGVCLPVLAVELLNSAVEAVIERYGPEHHELAGRAKDMGSAAVFVLMMNVLLVWALVLLPRLS